MKRRRATLAASAGLVSVLLALAASASASFAPGVIGVRLPVFSDPAWSPDGRWIAFLDDTGIELRGVDGSRRHLRAPPLTFFPVASGPLNWSPDGSELRYVTSKGPAKHRGSWVTTIHSDGTGLRQVALGFLAMEAHWSPQDWPMVFTTGPYAYELDHGALGQKPAVWTLNGLRDNPRRIFIKGRLDIMEPSFSPDGERILFYRTNYIHSSLWTMDADGADPRRLVGRRNLYFVSWSPGGGEIALVATAGRENRGQRLYTVPADDGPLLELSREEPLGRPVWSPDGEWIAFANYEGQIKRVRRDGSGEEVIASLPGKEIQNLLWSPDGTHLAYAARPFPVETRRR